MVFAMNIVSAFEETGVGLQCSTFLLLSQPDNFSFGDATIFVAVDGFVYPILALYVDRVLPGNLVLPRKCFYGTWYLPSEI